MCIYAYVYIYIPCHPVHRHSLVAFSAACFWGQLRPHPSAVAPPMPGAHRALPHGEQCSPEGSLYSPSHYSARKVMFMEIMSVIWRKKEVQTEVKTHTPSLSVCIPVTGWWLFPGYHEDRLGSAGCCHSDPSYSVWRCTLEEAWPPNHQINTKNTALLHCVQEVHTFKT